MAQLVSAGILYIQGCRFKSYYPDSIDFVDIDKNMGKTWVRVPSDPLKPKLNQGSDLELIAY